MGESKGVWPLWSFCLRHDAEGSNLQDASEDGSVSYRWRKRTWQLASETLTSPVALVVLDQVQVWCTKGKFQSTNCP